MLPALLLALLGVALTLPGNQSLTCKHLTQSFVRDVHQLPLQWVASHFDCPGGWGCQDTVLLIENGVQAIVVVSKGCAEAEDHPARTTLHRAPPGLSVISYSHVCRQGDFCNSLNNTLPVWPGARSPDWKVPSPPAAPGPGRVRCPACLSTDYCPEGGPVLSCPSGRTHCYNGVVRLRSEDFSTNLRIQGCTEQAGCNLLGGTQRIGSLSVSELCDLKDSRICHQGHLDLLASNPIQEPSEWTSSDSQKCGAGQLCQETLLLIAAGNRTVVLGSKGCIQSPAKDTQAVSIHSRPPGVLVASYTRSCASSWCNNAESIGVLLRALPPSGSPAPGTLRCPTCLFFTEKCAGGQVMTCPAGNTRCYSGRLEVREDLQPLVGVNLTVSVQGCLSNSSLLNHLQSIGPFSVREILDSEDPEKPHLQNGAAPAPYLTGVVGLGLSLALWCGGLCPPS
ncbi:CD177 antigen [Dasypus novemcinctus]|uniref:CD177 antigen n=1 Tax=Dasypus novemcinctus TaxID=9361 RepID=UPI00265F71B7|nr:CD177 antigen [Dasypus novemcinctus]